MKTTWAVVIGAIPRRRLREVRSGGLIQVMARPPTKPEVRCNGASVRRRRDVEQVMTRFRGLVLGMVAAAGVAAATPSAALTYVHFSFDAGATPVQGVYTLDCPSGGGSCAILALDGTFGATPISLATPPYPPGATTRDNLLTVPGFQPTANGFDFWPDPVVGPDDWRLWKAIGEGLELERDYATYVQQYLVTDYTTSIPEPGVWAMMLIGVAGLGAALRRRRAPVSGPAPAV
jgi:hypothetical protein